MLELKLLGQPSVSIDGKHVESLAPDKAMALLCYLAMNPGGHAREKLADLLWGNFPAERSKANLRQTLYNLQNMVPGYLEIDRWTARFLHDQPSWVDAEEFAAKATHSEISGPGTATALLSEHPTAIKNLESAVALYQGDFMAGVYIDGAPSYESWAGGERERLRLLLLKALESLGAHYERRQDYQKATGTLRRILSIEPWHEASHRRLMLLLARQGEFEAALKQYEQGQAILREELDIEPLPETTALYERIRAARVSRPRPIPSQANPFIGSPEELRHFQRLLLDDGAGLVTIYGLGGSGKTRLALAAAEALEPAFLEGVAYAPLVGVGDLAGLYSAIAHSLGIKIQGTGDPLQQVAGYLSGKEVLLVLDNFEQLTEYASTLEKMLAEAPRARMLVTSRRRLNLRGEQPFLLEGLRITDEETILESPAGQLFLQTARRARPGFTADETDRKHIYRICRNVEGLPLGIELAASWLKLMSCAQIAREMEADKRFLATSQLRGTERQTSLWATFSYSWRMLREEEKVTFKRLSVFRGGFDRERAQAATGTRLETLSALVDMSLIKAAGGERYEIHELLRQFAADKLEEDDAFASEAKDAHSRTYLEWLAGWEMRLKQAGLEEATTAIETDWDNIRRAWEWAVSQKSFGLIDKSINALYEFCNLKQFYREGQTLFSLAAESFDGQPGHEMLSARLQMALGAFYFTLGRVEESLQELQESRETFQRAEHEQELALNLMWTGFVIGNTGFRGQVSEGEALLEESLRLFESVGDDYYRARCLGNLGNNLVSQGKYELACEYYQRSLAEFERLDIAWGQAGTLVMLGKYLPLVDRSHGEGPEYLEKGLAIARLIENKNVMAAALSGLGVAAEARAEFQTAQAYFQEALDYAQAVGNKILVADQLNFLGKVAYQLKESKQAHSYFQRSLALIEQYGYRSILGRLQTNLGILARDEGNFEVAAGHFWEALRVEGELEQVGFALQTLNEIAEMERQKGGLSPHLPELLAFLGSHPLATPAIREQVDEIARSLQIELPLEQEADAAERPLEEIVAMVREEMLLN
ncbi:MAG: tetratricopeptide repeat protein [Anaerolineales bacterium]|nr:tetratricopeptide repeat protein [Anaerolineales bacterium]